MVLQYWLVVTDIKVIQSLIWNNKMKKLESKVATYTCNSSSKHLVPNSVSTSTSSTMVDPQGFKRLHGNPFLKEPYN